MAKHIFFYKSNLIFVISEAATIGVLEEQVFLKIGVLKMARWNLLSKSSEKTYEMIHFSKALACSLLKNEVLHRYFLRVLTANFRITILQNNYFWLAAVFISFIFTTPSIFMFSIVFLLSEVYKSGNNRKLMASSSSDKIFIRCSESFKQNTSLLEHDNVMIKMKNIISKRFQSNHMP